jgi:hypothetical protein
MLQNQGTNQGYRALSSNNKACRVFADPKFFIQAMGKAKKVDFSILYF